MNWKKGDKALCIKTGPLPYQTEGPYPLVRLGVEYTVLAVSICGCGSVALDIGIASSSNGRGTVCSCGAESSSTSGIWWVAAERFTKAKSLTEQKEEALKNEDYETLIKLKDNETNS